MTYPVLLPDLRPSLLPIDSRIPRAVNRINEDVAGLQTRNVLCEVVDAEICSTKRGILFDLHWYAAPTARHTSPDFSALTVL